MSYFSKSHTHMPSCPPLSQLWVGQSTCRNGSDLLATENTWKRSYVEQTVTSFLWGGSSGQGAFKAGSGFGDYMASRVITWP